MTPGPPFTWKKIGAFLGLPETLTKRWWYGLASTPQGTARSLYLDVVTWESTPYGTPTHLVYHTFAPPRLVETIETLVEERRLSRRQGNDIEECILRLTDREGGWLGSHASIRRQIDAAFRRRTA